MNLDNDLIFKYLDVKAPGIIKNNGIKLIEKKFKLSEDKAIKIYNAWRKEWLTYKWRA